MSRPVCRGGNYFDVPGNARCAVRLGLAGSHYSDSRDGFRICLGPPRAKGHSHVARAAPTAAAVSTSPADTPLDPCVLTRACERVLGGSLRAAVRLLQGAQPLPPTADTVEQVLSL